MVTIKGVIHASLLFHSAANIRSCLILSCGKKSWLSWWVYQNRSLG